MEKLNEIRSRPQKNENPNDLFDWVSLEKGFDINTLNMKLTELLGNDYKEKWAEKNFKKEVFVLADNFVNYIGSPFLGEIFKKQKEDLKNTEFDEIVKTLTGNGNVYNQLKNCIFAKILLVSFYVKQKPEFANANLFHQKLMEELEKEYKISEEENPISVSFFYDKALFAFGNGTITAGFKSREKTEESMVFKLLRQKEQDFEKMIRDLVGFRFVVENNFNGKSNALSIFYNLINKFSQIGYDVELGEIADVNFLEDDDSEQKMQSLVDDLLKNGNITKADNFEVGRNPTSASAVKFATFKMTGRLKKENTEYPFEIQIEKQGNKNEKKQQAPIVFKTRQRIQLLTRLFGKVPEVDLEEFVEKMVEQENQKNLAEEKQKRTQNIIKWALDNKNVKKLTNQNKKVYYIWLPIWQEWQRTGLLSKKQKEILEKNN